MLLAVGSRLGPYEIIAPLGAGGMGEVYRARDTRLARVVAVKLLTGPIDHDARGRLLEEARAAAALNHPNICTIHEIADVDNRLFIVMELVDGRLLSEVAAEGPPIETAVRYGIQIMDALAHAHDRGIVHRDLKTANLMLTSDGRVKVLDFGIAHRFVDPAIDSATQMPTLALGLAAGTLAYIAPEVLRGGIADRRSDIWAIGVVLYELLAGRRPFGGETTFELSSAILRDSLPPLPTRVPKPLRALVARCLEKDPAQRYQRAGEVRAALEMIAAGTAAAKSSSRSRTTRAPKATASTRTRAAGATRIRAIAVLPLDNLSRDPEQEYFADGMTEALIGAVARIEGLRVISRTSIMRYKGTRKSVPEIARDLNVDGIIGGSVRRVGDRVRIAAHLVDPQTDTYVWTANYDRDLHDVLALETEIGEAVASQIALKVVPTHRARSSTPRRVDPETYLLYLKARHSWNQPTEPALRRAIQWFEQAIERDPSYAPAYAGLADAYYYLGLFESLAPRDAHAHGAPAAQRALELDPTLADAHAAVANFKFSFEWDWAAADREYRRAIELNASGSLIRWHYALYLGNLGRLDEALEQLEEARSLDPLFVAPHQSLAYFSFVAGRYEESQAHHRTALEIDPNYPMALMTAGWLAHHFGRSDEAAGYIQRAMSISATPLYAGCFGLYCAMNGRREDAEAVLRDLRQRGSKGYVSHAVLSWLHAALGDIDEGVRCLRVAHEQHDSMFIGMPTLFCWDPLRDTDAFRDIVAQMKFPRPVRQAPARLASAAVLEAPPAASAPVAPSAEKSIIVLPFANLSPDADDAYFSDGLTDELITDLSRVAGLRVAPAAASFRLKKADKDLAAIARDFNVRYIVEGRVRKAGQSIRITAQLVDVAEDRTIWADKYSGEFEQVFELQERVSRSIAEALQLRLQPASRAPKPDATEAFLKGRHFARQATSAGFQKALEYFHRATELDPNYAPAFAALAEVYVNLTTGWDTLPALDTMPKAQAAAQRALALDPVLPEAHAVLALVAMYYEWDLQTAERGFKEALRLNPGYTDAHQWYAALLIWLDTRYDEALSHTQRASSLDSVDPWTQVQTVWVYAFSRDYTRAVAQARQVVASDPSYGFGHYALGNALIWAGRADEAISCFQRGIDLDGRGTHHVALLGTAHAITGQQDKALACLAELDALDRAGRNVATWKLVVYAGLGDADQVIRCLEVVVDQRTSSTVFMVTNPFLDFVRQDPRFVALLQKMGLGYLTTRTWTPEWRPPAIQPAPQPAEKPRIQSTGPRNTVGRVAEHVALRAALSDVESGHGLLIGVAGEPGLGKTVLVSEFTDELQSEGAAVCVGRGRCSERLAGTEAYLPWLEALDDLRRTVPHADALMRETAPAWYAQLESGGSPAAPAATQERLKRELTAFLGALGKQRPVLLFLDDVHWADSSTVDALAYVAARFDTIRALVIATYRPTDLVRAKHPFAALKLELESRGTCRELAVAFLTRDDVERFLAAEFPDHDLPAGLPRVIHARTEGNPLFMAGLLRYLRDRGVIARRADRWVMTEGLDAVEGDLPASVRSMIQYKIDRLSEEERRLLTAASVQGVDFHASVVAQALRLDVVEAEERFEAVERLHGLTSLVAEEELPDRSLTRRYRFVHVLYQNGLYASIAPARRAALSSAVAEAVLSHHTQKPDVVASEVAMLFEAARAFDRAAHFFDLAARYAARMSANAEVVALARRGLLCVEALPAGAPRDEAELALLLTLGPAEMAQRGWSAPEMAATFSRAQTLSAQLGKPTQLFKALFGLFAYQYVRADLRAAGAVTAALLDTAARSGNAVCRLHAAWAEACLAYNSGSLADARLLLERALQHADPDTPLDVALEYGQDAAIGIRVYQEGVFALMGESGAADAIGREAIARARALGHPFTLCYALSLSAMAKLYRRDFEGAQQCASETLSVAGQHGFDFFLQYQQVVLARTRGELGDAAQIAILRRLIDEMRAADVGILRSGHLSSLADACRREGRLDEAKRAIAEAEADAEKSGERLFIAEIHRIAAEIALDESPQNAGRAEELLRRAIDEAKQQHALLFELRAALALGRLWAGQGRRAEAVALVTAVADRMPDDGPDRRDARAFLDSENA